MGFVQSTKRERQQQDSDKEEAASEGGAPGEEPEAADEHKE
jgi:hypothetical protein